MTPLLLTALVPSLVASASGVADDAAHARAQRAARIARFHAAWDEAEVRPRELAAARLAVAGDAWPSDAELDAGAAILLGRAEPATESERALQQLADALDLTAAPGWAEGVSLDGARGAFQLAVELSRAVALESALDGPLTLRVLAPRERIALASKDVRRADLAHVELDARLPIATEVGVELAVQLERKDGERIERASTRTLFYPLLPDLHQRVAALPRAVERALPRVDLPRAIDALELLGATGRQAGIARDPLLLLGALELNEIIATQASIEHHGTGGLRLCGPLELAAQSQQRWIGWQSGPAVERLVWIWSSPEQPYDALFVGPDALAQEWQRIASGRGWLLVANEPREPAVARACLDELRTAFAGAPVTLVVRGAAAVPAIDVDEFVCVAHAAPKFDPPRSTPLLWIATGAPVHAPLPPNIERVEGPASAFLADPTVPRELDAWREARRRR